MGPFSTWRNSVHLGVPPLNPPPNQRLIKPPPPLFFGLSIKALRGVKRSLYNPFSGPPRVPPKPWVLHYLFIIFVFCLYIQIQIEDEESEKAWRRDATLIWSSNLCCLRRFSQAPLWNKQSKSLKKQMLRLKILKNVYVGPHGPVLNLTEFCASGCTASKPPS